MTETGLIVAFVCLVLGLTFAARARGRSRDRATLLGLGFAPAPAADGALLTMTRTGRRIEARATPDALTLDLPLAPAPLAYEVMARALGQGALLASLFELGARAHADRLVASLPAGLRPRALERTLSNLLALAAALETLPRAEAMARWYLELATGEDRDEALARLLAAFPDTPETLAACRVEVDQPRDLRAAARARAHLEAARSRALAGRPVPPDV